MKKTVLGTLLVLTCACLGHSSQAMAQGGDFESQIQALEWRHIGPFNGGRGTTVVGHPTEPQVFYFGHGSGGLWKTVDAGRYWTPLGDGQFNYASVGAMAISDKNPDILYVGLGEPQMRQSVSYGDGMYKSVDGGETWTHIGLSDSLHISRVRIHPENPDVVYVASLGHAFGPNEEKGVFRTRDGGKSWEKVLFVSPKAGAIDLVMNPSNPDHLFAAMWEFERRAWGAKTAGPDSGIFRSLDGGDTWEDISENPGMPEGMMGRVGLTMSNADPKRVYALIDSETKMGLYRSDDLGVNWYFVSDDSAITSRPFYFFHIYANPSDPDDLWASANKLWRSQDAGVTWVLEPGVKDDYQDIWIDPKDPNRIIATCDGGTQVSMTGGDSWSTFSNQSGVQFYRVETDDEFPYNLYGNPQDLMAYKIPSASRWGGIALHMTEYWGNGETGPAIPHPDNPDIVYSLSTAAVFGAAAHFTINNLETGQSETRSVWPEVLFGTEASEFKYRFNWQAPFLISPHNSNTIYMAANVVFRTRDEGMSWEVISGDLTHNMEDKMKVAGAPWLPEYFGQETFSTIHRLVESPHEKGLLWAGTDDGRIHLTKNSGEDWAEVTPPDLPELSAVYEIEISPHDPATAYVAITRYRKDDDYSPYLLGTKNYGQTWTRLDGSFPKGEITRTIREDTVRQGLLFVGTETGVFASIDDGATWRRMNLNMPRVPVHDLKIKNADLIAATHGRGFWIMDNISPLRAYSPDLAKKTAHLFTPETHYRFGYNWWMAYGGGPPSDKKYYFVRNGEPGHTFYERGVVDGEKKREFIDAGDAKPQGAVFYYLLSDEAKDVSLSILDAKGNEIRTFGSEEISMEQFSRRDGSEYGGGQVAGQATTSLGAGLNRFMWDMRYPSVSAIPGLPPVVINPIAVPGTYQVRLTVNGESQTESFQLEMNPKETYSREETDAKGEFWMKLQAKAEDGVQAVLKARAAKDKVAKALEAAQGGDADLEAQAAVIDTLCTDLEGSMVATGATLVQIISEPTKALAKLVMLHNIMETTEGPPNQPMLEVFDKTAGEIDAAIAEFDAALAKEMAKYDEMAR